jgi:hypothetical protein
MSSERARQTVDEALRRKYGSEERLGFGPLDFVYAVGSPVDLVMYAHLLWPEFVSKGGCVVLLRAVEDEEDLARLAHSVEKDGVQKTEESFNFGEVSELFGPRINDADDKLNEVLVSILSQTWEAKLATEFPEKSFRVVTLSPMETNDSHGVTFFQV